MHPILLMLKQICQLTNNTSQGDCGVRVHLRVHLQLEVAHRLRKSDIHEMRVTHVVLWQFCSDEFHTRLLHVGVRHNSRCKCADLCIERLVA